MQITPYDSPNSDAHEPGVTYSGGTIRVYSYLLDQAQKGLAASTIELGLLQGKIASVHNLMQQLAFSVRMCPNMEGLAVPVPTNGIGYSEVDTLHTALASTAADLGSAAANYREQESSITTAFRVNSASRTGNPDRLDYSYATEGETMGFDDVGNLGNIFVSGPLGSLMVYKMKRSSYWKFKSEVSITPVTTAPFSEVGSQVSEPLTDQARRVEYAANRSNKDSMAVTITNFDANGSKIAAVAVGGTQDPGLDPEAPNAQDGANMAQEFAGLNSEALLALKATIEAKVPEGTTLVLSGHSQGGALMRHLAAMPDFTAKYKIAFVSTYGAPQTPDVPGISSYATPGIEMTNDGDPLVEVGGASTVNPNTTYITNYRNTPAEAAEYTADAKAASFGESLIVAHGMKYYVQGAKKVARGRDPRAMAARAPLDNLMKGAVVTSETTYSVRRERLTPAGLKQREAAEAAAKAKRLDDLAAGAIEGMQQNY